MFVIHPRGLVARVCKVFLQSRINDSVRKNDQEYEQKKET